MSPIRARTVAYSQSAEQARNRDHHSSDPCGQDRKQHKISQKHGHTDASPFPSLCKTILALQSVGLCSIADSRTITNCFLPASPRIVRPSRTDFAIDGVGLAKILLAMSRVSGTQLVVLVRG